MPREPQTVTEAELAILQALWKNGPQSIRQLTDALHPRNDASTYATVKKQLDRMEGKSLIKRDRSLFVHVFSAAVGREDLVGRGLEDLAERFCEGSFAPILGFLGKSKPLTAAEREALRALLDEGTANPRPRRDRKEQSMDRLLQFILSNAIAAMALAILAAGAGRLLNRAPLTRALWILVLLKLVTPPVWTVPVWAHAKPAEKTPVATNAKVIAPEPVEEITTISDQPFDTENQPAVADNAPSGVEATAPATGQAPTGEGGRAPVPWFAVGCILWLAGAFTCFLLILRSSLRLRGIVRQGVPAPLGIRKRARHLARLMDLGRCPEILFAWGPLPPMLCATGLRPRIILPASLWSRLDVDQQDTVLVHELAHLRHGDHWVRRLELFVAVLYWWHPAVWWSRSELRESSEQCCDAWVVWALPRLARSYAAALVETVDFISLSPPSLPVLASGMGQFTDLRRRLVMINQASSAPRALSRGGYWAVCSLAGLLLPLAPSFGQEAEPVPLAPPAPPAIVEIAPPEAYAPLAPEPAPAPKANILVAPIPFAYSADEEASPNDNQNRDEIQRARADVSRLRSQLRQAERRLEQLQGNLDREKDRTKEREEAQKERTKALAQAQKERTKALADAQKARAKAVEERQRAMQERQGVDYGINPPKPRIDTSFRFTPKEQAAQQDYVRAGARLRAAGGEQGGNDALEQRLDRMEKQLNEMVGQLRQMKQQVSRPAPRPAPRKGDLQEQ